MLRAVRYRQVDTRQIRSHRFTDQRVILWRCLRGQKTGGTLAWAAIMLMSLLMLASPCMAQSSVDNLLSGLNLSEYPSGMWPPPFKGQTLSGEAVSLAALKGRVVLVNFWASWCVECRPEMPMFEQLHQAFAQQGLTVLGINHRESATRIARFAERIGLTFPLVFDPQGEITASYGVIGLPSTFLVARDGRPVALAIGPRAWDGPAARAIVRALLAETVAKKGKE